MPDQSRKRPRDRNALAAAIVGEATDEITDPHHRDIAGLLD